MIVIYPESVRLCTQLYSFTHTDGKAESGQQTKILSQTHAFRRSQSENQEETIYSASRPLAQGYHEHG